MKKLIGHIFLIGLIFSILGCSPYRQVKPNEVIESKSLSYTVPDTNWEIDKEYKRVEWKYQNGLPYIYHSTENIQFSIYIFQYLGGSHEELFKVDGRYLDSDIEEVKISEGGKKTGVTYSKQDIAYVNHLKCSRGVFSRGFGGSYYSGGVKFYGMECGYYDTTEMANDGKKILNIDYRYTHNTKNLEESLKTEKKIKEAVKKAISTLQIKNFDIKRMEAEGLMHYDKIFESTKW